MLLIAASIECTSPAFEHVEPDGNDENTSPEKPPVILVFGQDASGSIKKRGVELSSSKVFDQLYLETSRDIDVYFGIISEQSSKKMIHLFLARQYFSRPLLPKQEKGSLWQESQLKKSYRKALQQFLSDSIAYWDARFAAIGTFRQEIDTLIEKARRQLAETTDLVTIVHIADRIFNQSSNAEKVLILNSDGIDSGGRTVTTMQNKATVILCGANDLPSTCIDSIVTQKLASPEDAIKYILNHQNQTK